MKKFKKLQREVDKMAAMMNEHDDEDEDDEDAEPKPEPVESEEEADETDEESESDEESEEESDDSESEPEVINRNVRAFVHVRNHFTHFSRHIGARRIRPTTRRRPTTIRASSDTTGDWRR